MEVVASDKHLAAAYGEDGRPRGFGHLDFAESASVAKAQKKHGSDFMGREIFVDVAGNSKPRGDRPERAPRQEGQHSEQV